MQETMTAKQKEQLVFRISWHSMIVNFILSGAKVAAGFFGQSAAMISDGVHSASDVFSTIIVMVGYKMSEKESDEDHQYGHERLECVAAILLAAVLCATGVAIGRNGIEVILHPEGIANVFPKTIALVAAVVSIVVKEGMYWYTKDGAERVKSDAMMADAWHHRTDALSSVGSLVGIIGARMGFPICDPIASVLIAGFILKAAYDIFKEAVNKLTDVACDSETIVKIQEIALQETEVIAIDTLQTRLFGAKIYVDMEISVNREMSLLHAHEVAHRVHDAIEANLLDVKHCMVHVNPYME